MDYYEPFLQTTTRRYSHKSIWIAPFREVSKSQLTLLLLLLLRCWLSSFYHRDVLFIQLYGHEEWGERLWVVYNNFVDPGNQIEETAWPNRILVGLISISGSILLGGVLISTISNIIERRVEVVNTGE